MIRKRLKSLSKDALAIGVTGIGLGVGAGIAGQAGSPQAASALGNIGGKLGTVANISIMGHTLGMLQDSLPKKKHMRY